MLRVLAVALLVVTAPACKRKPDWTQETKKGSGSGSGSGSSSGSGSGGHGSSDSDDPPIKKHPLAASGSPLDGATALAVSAQNACAMIDSKILCWEPGKPAEPVNPPSAPIAIAGPCALTDAGDVWCVAPKEMKAPANTSSGGQIAATMSEVCVGHRMDIKCWHIGDPDPYAAFGWAGVDKIDLGDGKLCSVVSGGVIECADITKKDIKAFPIDGPDNVAELALGGSLACAVLDKGGVECWLNPAKRTKVPTVTTATDIAVGPTGDACALVDHGEVACWHVDGAKTSVDKAGVKRIGGVSGAQAIGVGAGYGCAINGDSKVVCWGKASKEPQNAQSVSVK